MPDVSPSHLEQRRATLAAMGRPVGKLRPPRARLARLSAVPALVALVALTCRAHSPIVPRARRTDCLHRPSSALCLVRRDGRWRSFARTELDWRYNGAWCGWRSFCRGRTWWSFHDMDEIFLRGISDRTKPNVSLLCKQPNVLNQSGKKIEDPVGCD